MIRLAGVCKSYGALAVLRDFDLAVAPGELVLVQGPSGAGKTTLLRLIHGAERPDRGDVIVAGKKVALLRRSALPYLRRNIGFVFQDFALIEQRSAYENVALALEVRGVGRREAWRRATQALADVGLADRAGTAALRLSGGEQQRVAFARAVVGEPPIVLADEPTGNLDPTQSRIVLALLAEQAARGAAVLVATHDPAVARAFGAARVVRLDREARAEGGEAPARDLEFVRLA